MGDGSCVERATRGGRPSLPCAVVWWNEAKKCCHHSGGAPRTTCSSHLGTPFHSHALPPTPSQQLFSMRHILSEANSGSWENLWHTIMIPDTSSGDNRRYAPSFQHFRRASSLTSSPRSLLRTPISRESILCCLSRALLWRRCRVWPALTNFAQVLFQCCPQLFQPCHLLFVTRLECSGAPKTNLS